MTRATDEPEALIVVSRMQEAGMLTVCAHILPDMSIRGVRSAGNMSARALAMLVCSALPLALVPSRIWASFQGRHSLALHSSTYCTVLLPPMLSLLIMFCC